MSPRLSRLEEIAYRLRSMPLTLQSGAAFYAQLMHNLAAFATEVGPADQPYLKVDLPSPDQPDSVYFENGKIVMIKPEPNANRRILIRPEPGNFAVEYILNNQALSSWEAQAAAIEALRQAALSSFSGGIRRGRQSHLNV